MQDELQRRAHDHLLLHFTRNQEFADGGTELPILTRGEGPYVFDTHGRQLLDGLSSLFCCQIGYSYGAELGEVAAAQMRQLAFNTVWRTAHPPAIELAAKLAELAPGDLSHVFFTSGGSESVEAAWKIARQFHVVNGEPTRTKAIARRTAYHGVTLGALSFTGVEGMKVPFGRPAVEVFHVSNTNRFRADDADESAFCGRLLDEIEQLIEREGAESIAMIIAEPVQNSGGSIVPPAGYWQGLRRLADRYGILLVADEVICGFGRLGTWFGSERVGALPDLLTTAKGISSGYAPLGAVMVSQRVAGALMSEGTTLLHGVTFGGHPVATAVGLRNLEIFERDGILANVRSLEGELEANLEALRDLPIVGDVRGVGFFWSVELVKDEDGTRFDQGERERLLRGFLPESLWRAGVIARADDRGDSVLTLAPPLVSDSSFLRELTDRISAVLEEAGRYMGLSGAHSVKTSRDGTTVSSSPP